MESNKSSSCTADCAADIAGQSVGPRDGSGETQGEPPIFSGREIATVMMHIQTKRFYFHVRENRWGRFMKVLEYTAEGKSSHIFFPLSVAKDLCDHLTKFNKYYAELGPLKTENPDSLQLLSETLVKDDRRYYLDFRANNRGRFLRVTQTATGVLGSVGRSKISIPAQGMVEFRNKLMHLLDDFGGDELNQFPEGSHLKAGHLDYYFNMGKGNQGAFMRITEVDGYHRSCITVPKPLLTEFRNILGNYCDPDVQMVNEVTPGEKEEDNDSMIEGKPKVDT